MKKPIQPKRAKAAPTRTAAEQVWVTFFPDPYAKRKTEEWLTLEALAERIGATTGATKPDLPWLKLAQFGETRSKKDSLRTNANVLAIFGIEGEHDQGTVSLAEAVRRLEAVGVEALVYSSPSFEPGVKERWRVLCPLSRTISADGRSALCARLNGILGGALAPESFDLSRSYWFGHLPGAAHREVVLKGRFLDECGEVEGIERPSRLGEGLSSPSGNIKAYSDEELSVLLERSKVRKTEKHAGQWHEAMLSVTAALVARGMTDREIFDITEDYCDGGWGDPDLGPLIATAREKYRQPDSDLTLLRLAPLLKTLAAQPKSGGSGGTGRGTMFGKTPPEGVTIEDFRAHMPTHTYIFKPLGNTWPMQSINSRLPTVKVQRADGTIVPVVPSVWLDRNRAVEQMLWAPGLPQVIDGKMLAEGGWIEREGVAAFNTYRPPIIRAGGNGSRAGRWIDLLEKIYPDDAAHIVAYFAHRIQRPEEKINHGLVLIGVPGIGKDTLIEPLRWGVGPWNFREISPHDIVSRWNDFMQAVVVRVSEAQDLGEINRYRLYEKMKTMLAAPPDTIRVDSKFLRQFYVVNVAGFIITTNYRHDGLYLPPNDRRHYVAGTEVTAADFKEGYWNDIWGWYQEDGIDDVIAYLKGYDLAAAGFDPKATPEKTEAFWQLVGAAVAPEVSELDDALATLKTPKVVTLYQLQGAAGTELRQWLADRSNRRAIPHRMEACGYVPVRNPARKDGLWIINERRQTIYGKLDITPAERAVLGHQMVADLEKQKEEMMRKLQREADEKKKPRQ